MAVTITEHDIERHVSDEVSSSKFFATVPPQIRQTRTATIEHVQTRNACEEQSEKVVGQIEPTPIARKFQVHT